MSPLEVDLEEVEYVQDTKLTIRGSRRRTTVPKAIVERLGLSGGSSIRWVLFRDGRILVLRVMPSRPWGDGPSEEARGAPGSARPGGGWADSGRRPPGRGRLRGDRRSAPTSTTRPGTKGAALRSTP